jgi:hypothetical protein
MDLLIKSLYNQWDEVVKPDANLGIVRLSVHDVEPTFMQFNWLLVTDRSGSMDASTSATYGGTSKLDALKHTMRKMFEYFYKDAQDRGSTHNVVVTLFDHEVNQFTVKIDKDTEMTHHYRAVSEITSGGMTNMYKGIQMASQTKEMLINAKTVMVILSDGEITSGVSCKEKIGQLLLDYKEDELFSSRVVGYGADHSVKLLSYLAEITKGEYHCIESVEGAGVVYGEIVHGIVYEAGRNGFIKIENGEVYDPMKCKWTDSIEINEFAAGKTYTWSLRRNIEEPVSVQVTYTNIEEGKLVTAVINKDTITHPEVGVEDRDVRLYDLRQKTLELLGETKARCQERDNPSKHRRQLPPCLRPSKMRRITTSLYDDHVDIGHRQQLFESLPHVIEQDPLEAKLDAHMEVLKQAKIKYGEDEFIITLCDDIYVAKKALTSSNGLSYLAARHVTQGLQRCYNPVDLTGLEVADSDDDYEMSQNILTPFMNRQSSAGTVIRSISSRDKASSTLN